MTLYSGTCNACGGEGSIESTACPPDERYPFDGLRTIWEYIWAIFPKAILWPAFMVYEGFRALGA